jgi:hypothetical protein
MTQNRSWAVMQQRVEPADSLDDFPTPLWATRALCEWIAALPNHAIGRLDCWEPACGRGHMARALAEYFRDVLATDIGAYQPAPGLRLDFLAATRSMRTDWIITNPPFRLALEFALTALERAEVGVALLVRSAWLEGCARHRFFSAHRPSDILQFSERVVMVKGRLSEKGSTATAYSWVVWRNLAEQADTRFDWIAPSRKKLERPGDWE